MATTEVKGKKIPKAVADAMLASGDITQEMYNKWVSAGRVTSGTGGGPKCSDQLVSAGVPEELVRELERALKKVNDALWSGKEYVGNKISHKNKKGEDVMAAIEAAIWVKHYGDDEE